MARQKQQDQDSANKKPSTQTTGKSLTDAPEGAKNKAKSSKGKVDPMKKE